MYGLTVTNIYKNKVTYFIQIRASSCLFAVHSRRKCCCTSFISNCFIIHRMCPFFLSQLINSCPRRDSLDHMKDQFVCICTKNNLSRTFGYTVSTRAATPLAGLHLTELSLKQNQRTELCVQSWKLTSL